MDVFCGWNKMEGIVSLPRKEIAAQLYVQNVMTTLWGSKLLKLGNMFEWGMTGMTGEPMKYMILGDWKKPEWPVRAIIPQQLEQNLIFSFTIYTCTQRTATNN